MSADLTPDSRLWARLTLATLALAIALRFVLAAAGGQNYWPDEGRYHNAGIAVDDFRRGEMKAGALALVGTADHLFFKVVALPMAWADARFGYSPVRTACAISLFSVATLALMWTCARRMGAPRREAWLAVFLGACANSLFYYARHLFPYDVALCFCMASLALSLGPGSLRRSFAAGILAGLGFLTYNGYWIIAGAVLVVHVLRARGPKGAVLRAGAGGLGLVLPLAAAVLTAHLLGSNLIASFRAFSGTVFQGDFGRGHAFVWQYLWSAEGMVLLFWLVGVAYACVRGWRSGMLERPLIWVAMAALLYAGLVVAADVMKVFVVYGRTARSVVPFLCMAAAWSANDLWERGRPRNRTALAILVLVALAAALNMAAPLRIVFDTEFISMATRVIRATPIGSFHVENARHLRPGEMADDDSDPGILLLYRHHPLQFRPYLFEGFTEAQRKYLTVHDIGMKLAWKPIAAAERLGGYPGPLQMRVRFAAGRAGYTDPVVTAGKGPNVSMVFMRYLDDSHVSFGYDCHGSGAIVSAPVTVDMNKEHMVLVFFGAMIPEEDPPGGSQEVRADWKKLRGSVLVRVDDRTILSARVATRPSGPGDIFVGVNLTTDGTAGPSMLGTVVSVQGTGLEEVAGQVRNDRLDDLRKDALWYGYPGPIRMSVVVPRGPEGTYEPLVTAGGPSAADSLCVSYKKNQALRLEFIRDGTAVHDKSLAVESLPFETGSDRRLDLVVSLGSLMPPEASHLYESHPEWRPLIDHVVVTVGGKVVLARRIEPSPSTPDDIRLLSNLVQLAGVDAYFNGTVGTLEAESPAAVIASIPRFGGDVDAPPPPLGDFPGPILLKLQFSSHPTDTAEPLVVTGVTGAGDIVFIRYDAPGKARFGVDHWAYGGPSSDPVDLGPDGTAHEVVVSSGGLYPPAADAIYKLHPEWLKLRDWTVVGLDGQPVLIAPVKAYAERSDQITTGYNGIGASTTETRYSGALATAFASPDVVLGWLVQAGKVQP